MSPRLPVRLPLERPRRHRLQRPLRDHSSPNTASQPVQSPHREAAFGEGEPLLQVEGIDVFYGPIQALRGLTFHLEAGEMVALLGANGAGKTTTLRAVSGLMHPTSGSIRFAGEEISQLPAHEVVSRGLAHLPEGRELFPTLPVEVNLRAGYWVRRHAEGYEEARERVMDLFPILRERAHQPAGTLSGGEQQMLAVARALMSDPRLLVVDELSLGLAPMIVQQLFEILREVNAAGTAVLIVEQFVHMALANTHRAYVLQKGEVVLEGRSDELLSDPHLIASYLGETEAPVTEAPAEQVGPRTRRRARASNDSRPGHPRGPVSRRGRRRS